MAGPSASELARKAQQDLLLLKTQFDALVKDLDSAEVRRLRERLAVVESRTAELEKTTEQLKPTEAKSEEMGALKNRLTQLEEQKKLGDTRLFQVMVLFIGGLITLAINIALLFLKK